MATDSNVLGARMCITNCGFYASGVSGYCSKCARTANAEEKAADVPIAPVAVTDVSNLSNLSNLSPGETGVQRSRCAVVSCRKKLGLAGFTCKCGKLFCGSHHQPEDHKCDFDHKAFGRDRIATENPVIVASKLERI